jgi:hypothetical protein
MKVSTAFSRFIPLMSKYSPQRPVLKHSGLIKFQAAYRVSKAKYVLFKEMSVPSQLAYFDVFYKENCFSRLKPSGI